MKIISFMLIILFMTTSAYGIIDPEPNRIGIYFDLDADAPCLEEIGPFTTHTAYIIFTRPTTPAVLGIAIGYSTMGSGMITSVMFPDDNPSIQPVGSISLTYLYPIVTTDTTVLVTFQTFYMGPANEPWTLYLHGHEATNDPKYPDIINADMVQKTILISAGIDGPTAQINGICGVVAGEKISFEGIKALYR